MALYDEKTLAALDDETLAGQAALLRGELRRRDVAELVALLREWLALPQTAAELGGEGVTHVLAGVGFYDNGAFFDLPSGTVRTTSGREVPIEELTLDEFAHYDRVEEISADLSDNLVEQSALVVDLAAGTAQVTTHQSARELLSRL